jgi:hypothetical protein
MDLIHLNFMACDMNNAVRHQKHLLFLLLVCLHQEQTLLALARTMASWTKAPSA